MTVSPRPHRLLEYPEFDFTVFHPNTLPLVGAILGGEENVRHIEFNYRAWQPITSDYGMSWHPDDCSGGLLTLEQRQTRFPYGPPDMLSTFTYLTVFTPPNPKCSVMWDVCGDTMTEFPACAFSLWVCLSC